MMFLIVCATDQFSGSILVMADESRVTILAFSFFMYCFRDFQLSPWCGDTHHSNSDKLERGSCLIPKRWIDFFVGDNNGLTVERDIHQVPIL